MGYLRRWLGNTRSLLTIWLGLSLLSILALAGLGFWGMYQIRSSEVREEAASRLVEQAYLLKIAAERQVVGIRGYALTGEARFLQPTQEGRRDFDRTMTSLGRAALTPSDARLLEQIRAQQARYLRNSENIVRLRRQGAEPADLMPSLEAGNGIKDDLLQELDRFISSLQASRAAVRDEVARVTRGVQGTLVGMSLLSLPMMLMLATLISQRIKVPLDDLESAAAAIADGRFNARVPQRADDAFGAVATGFNLMMGRIQSAMRALEQEKQFSELLLQAAGEGIFGLDADGRITFVNRAAAQLLGYSPRELIGQPVHDTLYHTLPDGSARPLERSPILLTLRKRRPSRVDQDLFWRKDRTSFPVEFTSTPLALDGEHPGAVVTFREITERLEAERAERLDRERVLALEHAQEIQRANHELERLNRKLEAASRMKSEFLANMSHELRTPLNSVIGYTELVMTDDQQELDAINRENLETVVRNARHLLSLINDILDLSKIEAGKLTLYPEPFQPEHTLAAVAITVGPLAHAKGLALETHVAPDIGWVVSDETKVRQIILNLVSNALKFTREGRVELRVEARPGDRWAVVVRDTGIGISTTDQSIVFEEFRQVDASTTREAGGTGLGLSISSKLARLLGGELTLESVPGKGSTFTLELPRTIEGYQAQAPASGAPRVAMLPATGRPSVLAIDDNPETLHLIAEKLKGSPFDIVTATSGDSGVMLAKELRPFAITLDVMMPHMDGWMVLRALKSDPITADIPVIILSFLENKAVGFSLGAAGYLTKPINRNELLATLEHLCPGGRCPGRVLVVEDDPDARALYAQVLQREGVSYREATNGAEALAALEQEKPLLVILDLMMPQVDGFEVLARMRANPATHDIPVIVVTAKDLSAADMERLSAARLVLSKDEAGRRLMDDLQAMLQAMVPREEARHDAGS